jgi:RNA polymerase sigma-70 factor (ECF subfamily)
VNDANRDFRASHLEGSGFTDTYTRYSRPILGFLMRRVFDAESAVDLTAETFSQALIARRRFRGSTEAELQAWLFAIARAQLSSYHRRGQAERRAIQRLGVQTPQLTEDDYARIEELASTEDLRAFVAEALGELSAGQRDALRLRVVDDLPYPTVAARLGISEDAARARVSRALRALAHAFDQRPASSETES